MTASQDEGSSDSSSWMSSEAGEICDDCRSINFARAFNTSKTASTKSSQLIRGAFKLNELRTEDCYLCSAIHFSASNWPDRDIRDWQLMAIPPPASISGSVGDTMSLNLATAGAVWLQAVPFGWSPKRKPITSTAPLAQLSGWIACYNTVCDPKMFLPKPISPVFDATIVRK